MALIWETYGCDIGNGFGFLSLLPPGEEVPREMIPPTRDLNPNAGMPTAAYVTPPSGEPILVFDPKSGSAQRKIRQKPSLGVRAVKTRLREELLDLPGLDAPVSPYAVYGAVARDLIRLGNLQRVQEGKQPIYRMVLTYPASFDNYDNGLELLNRMQKSVEEVTLDGHPLEVVGRLPEPAAVAIDYLHHLQHEVPEDQRLADNEFTALVFDLGHGTFDTAVVTARSVGEPYHVWATDGLPDVGGKDFDARLLEELTAILRQEYSYQLQNEQEREELLREAVDAKHELSGSEEAVIQHQSRRDGSYMELTITRQRFEELTQDMLVYLLEKTQKMMEYQLAKGRTIDAIVLSGGASQMPMVQKALKAHIQPTLPIYLYRPSKAVSFGAARYAQGLSLLEDVPETPEPVAPNPVVQLYTRHSYGIFVEVAEQLEGEIRFLLGPEVPLPATTKALECVSQGNRLICRIFRPKELTATAERMPPSDCVNLAWLSFDTPKGGKYSLTMTVDQNYNITVDLRAEDGSVQRRSTAGNQKTHHK